MSIAVRLISVCVLLALAVGCSSTSTSTPAQSVPDMLIASGFQTRESTTAMQKDAKLHSFAGNQISEIQAYGHTFYVYPDYPGNRVLVGGPAQYQAYQKLRQSRNLPAESSPPLYHGPSFDWRQWYNGVG